MINGNFFTPLRLFCFKKVTFSQVRRVSCKTDSCSTCLTNLMTRKSWWVSTRIFRISLKIRLLNVLLRNYFFSIIFLYFYDKIYDTRKYYQPWKFIWKETINLCTLSFIVYTMYLVRFIKNCNRKIMCLSQFLSNKWSEQSLLLSYQRKTIRGHLKWQSLCAIQICQNIISGPSTRFSGYKK